MVVGGGGMYEEPRVDVLASSRRDQLADALGQSARKNNSSQLMGVNEYGSGASEGEISPDGLLLRQDPHWIAHRAKLERALENDAPILELLIQSSATLIKGEKIQINALGLVSHESKRTSPKDPVGGGEGANEMQRISMGGAVDGQEQDLRDGCVYFGCKKSIK